MKDIRFTVPAIPIAQPRPRHVRTKSGKTITVSALKEHPVNAFTASCRMAARDAYCGPPLEGPLALSLIFVMPRPANKRWKKRAMPRMPHTCKPDADNLVKSFKDSLNKILWNDDSQIYELRCVKTIAAGDEQPHVEVVIWSGSGA